MALRTFMSEWYQSLLDDIGSALTETYKEARELVIRRTWEVGVRILQDKKNFEESHVHGESIVKKISTDLGKSPATIYNAIRIAEKWPNFEDIYKLEDGSNISLHKLVNRYLSDGQKDKPETTNCPTCGKSGYRQLEN